MQGLRQIARSPNHRTTSYSTAAKSSQLRANLPIISPVLFASQKEDDIEGGDQDDLESLHSLVDPDVMAEPFLHLYQWMEKNNRNPISLLMEHYQAQDEARDLKPQQMMQFDSVLVFNPKSKTSEKFWRCSFVCPVTDLEAASCVPEPLFLSSKDNYSRLAQATREFFRADYCFADQESLLCYYHKKQAAKTSCALDAVLRLDPERLGLIDAPVFVSCAKASCTPHAESIERKDEDDEDIKSSFPTWVEDLFATGIRKVDISYHQCADDEGEEENNTSNHNNTGHWKWDCSMRVFCRLVVRDPKPQMVQGRPNACKATALKSAVEILCNGIQRVKKISPASGIQRVKKISPASATMVKQQLLQSNPSTIIYRNTLPDWATAPFDHKLPTHYFLYELFLTTADGTPLSEQVMPWFGRSNAVHESKSSATRIGILFSRDILSPLDAARENSGAISFSVPMRDDPKSLATTATLKTRVVLSSCDHDVESLLAFNQLLMRWKQYGIRKNDYLLKDAYSRGACDRSYLFLPLSGATSEPSIDWDCILATVKHKSKPLYDATWMDWRMPLIGQYDSQSVGAFLLFASLCCYGSSLETLKATATAGLFLAAIAFSLHSLQPPRNVPANCVANYFLRHLDRLYVPLARTQEHDITGLAQLVGFDADAKRQESLRTRFGLDIKSATFRDYFRLRHGRQIRFPNIPFIRATCLTNHASSNPYEDMSREKQSYLVPEFCQVLPMPRDFLYTVNHAFRIMFYLERKIDIRGLATSMMDVDKECHLIRSVSPYAPSLSEEQADIFSQYLDLASSCYPASTFERLEFLGDRVLGYFAVLSASHTLVANRANRTEDYLNMEVLQDLIKNRALTDVALAIGIPRLIWSKRCAFLSAYSPKHAERDATVEIADSLLPDILEATLAAAYLSKSYVVLFKLLKSINVFRHTIVPNDAWCHWIEGVMSSIQNSCAWTDLSSGFETLTQILDLQSVLNGESVLPAKSFIQCALYNKDVRFFLKCERDFENENVETVELADSALGPSRDRLLLVKMLRAIGCRALHLCVCQSLFSLYAKATAGDLMMLFASIITDDALAYIFTKRGLHRALFDESAADEFLQASGRADVLGKEKWRQYEGWCLPGGVAKFQRRLETTDKPMYPGLCGGRLQGRSKKLPRKTTAELVFCFQALIGAMSLTLGLDATWNTFQPMFAEVLALSPPEVRDFTASTLVENYTQ